MIIRPTLSFLSPAAPFSSLTCFATSSFGEHAGDRYFDAGVGSGLSDVTRPAPGKSTLTSRLHAGHPKTDTFQTAAHSSDPAVGTLDDPFGLHLLGAQATTAAANQKTSRDLIATSDVDFGEVIVGGTYRRPLYFFNLHPSAPAYVTVTAGERNRDFVLIPPRSNNLLRRPAGEEQLPPAFVEENFFHLFWNPIEPGALNVPVTITLSWNETVKEPAQTKTIRIKGTAYAAGQEKPSVIVAREAEAKRAAEIRHEDDERSERLDRRVRHDNERDVVYPAGAVRELSAAYERAQDALTVLTEKQAIGARVAGEEAGRYHKMIQPQPPSQAASMADFVLRAANKGLSRYARKMVESALGANPLAAIAATLVSEIVSTAGEKAIQKILGNKSEADATAEDNSDIYFFAFLESMLRDSEFDRQTALQHTFDQLQTMTPKNRKDAVQTMSAIAQALRETADRAVKEQADLARYAWIRELALRELGERSRKTDGDRSAMIENALWFEKENDAPHRAGVLDITLLADRTHKEEPRIVSAHINGVIDEMAAVLGEKPIEELRRLGIVIRVTVKDPSLADSLGYVVVDRDQIVYLDKTGSPFRPESPYAANWLAYFSKEDRGTPIEERQNQGARELMTLIGTQTLGKIGIAVATDHDRKSR